MIEWMGTEGKKMAGSSGSGEPHVIVVGGVNIDIGGRSFSPLVAGDSNPGRVTVSLGGVGRNIAHNLSLLNVRVSMLTALGSDLYAQRVLASCAETGIDIRRALIVPDAATSTYIYLDDCDGDMALALSDMEICDRITPAYLERNLDLLRSADLIVLDANIPAESVEWIADRCTVPLFADPVSTKKAEKFRPVLGRLHTLKPNRLEAELLSGVRITDRESLLRAAEALLDTGLKRVFVTLGSEGVLAAGEEGFFSLPCFAAEIRNTTGAGDAFMAALVWATLEGYSAERACRAASAASALAVESSETVNPALSPEALRRRMESARRNEI